MLALGMRLTYFESPSMISDAGALFFRELLTCFLPVIFVIDVMLLNVIAIKLPVPLKKLHVSTWELYMTSISWFSYLNVHFKSITLRLGY